MILIYGQNFCGQCLVHNFYTIYSHTKFEESHDRSKLYAVNHHQHCCNTILSSHNLNRNEAVDFKFDMQVIRLHNSY